MWAGFRSKKIHQSAGNLVLMRLRLEFSLSCFQRLFHPLFGEYHHVKIVHNFGKPDSVVSEGKLMRISNNRKGWTLTLPLLSACQNQILPMAGNRPCDIACKKLGNHLSGK
jgi:hypothetical protein